MGQLTTILGVLGGIAAIFYAVGFITVQSYIYRYPLDGMFWFTSDFYRDAGAKFLLALIRTPLVAWYVFLPYLIVLYQLVPRDEVLRLHATRRQPALRRQWAQLLGLTLVITLTYVAALRFDLLMGSVAGAGAIDLLFGGFANSETLQIAQSLAFFCLVTPVMIAGGAFLWQYRACLLNKDGPNRQLYEVMLAGYLLFLAILPISYGFHLYDWRIVPIKNAGLLAKQLRADQPVAPGIQAWLLGEFGNKYVFLTKASATDNPVLEAVAIDSVKHLYLEPSHSVSLKVHLVRTTEKETKQAGISAFNSEGVEARP